MFTINQPVRFGANYVPSKNWWYSWMDWDHKSIAEDLRCTAALNIDHIRIHCLWPYFQPNPNYVSETAVNRLVELLTIADDCNLDVCVTVLDGWLSGYVFQPSWQRGRNMFTDAEVIKAEKYLFEKLAEAIYNHPRFLGFDLGNELGVLQDPNRTDPATAQEADDWLIEMLSHCETVAPGKMHVNGVDHTHWFKNLGFSRSALAQTGALTSIHTWTKWTGAEKRYGALGTGSIHIGEYHVELVKAYHTDPQRKVWIQEFGMGERLLPADRVFEFSQPFFRSALSCENLWGMTWWCTHNIRRDFTHFSPGEYTLGLLDENNRVKPNGRQVSDLIAEFRRNPPEPIKRKIAMVLSENVFSEDLDTVWSFIECYMQKIEAGIHPAIVLESRASDTAYLKSRGIESLIIE